MKWTNKGHELDGKADRLIERFKVSRKIYIFGAGLLGADLRIELEYFGCFAGFIDNDWEKQKEGVDGFAVISLSEYLRRKDEGIVVIAADQSNIPAISRQLEESGLRKDTDYYSGQEFQRRLVPVLAAYYYDVSYTEISQISLTERCTLRCEKCAHACPYSDNKTSDLSFEEVKKSADSFFRVTDVTKEFVLIGGEPLLYGQLAEAVAYIGSRYRNQMIIFSITTNGTLLPSREVLEQCGKYKVLFRISNYSAALPQLKRRYDELTGLLERWDIEYSLGKPEINWFDYGFDHVERDVSKKELTAVFDACGTKCHEVRGNKYYFCVMARSVSDNMGLGVGGEDYLDLDKLSGDDYKKILLEFNDGYSDKGYLEMCRRCNGAEALNYLIPPAKQCVRNAKSTGIFQDE